MELGRASRLRHLFVVAAMSLATHMAQAHNIANAAVAFDRFGKSSTALQEVAGAERTQRHTTKEPLVASARRPASRAAISAPALLL